MHVSMTMRIASCALVCLAFAGHVSRTHAAVESSPSEALTRFLLANNPSASFMSSGLGVHYPKRGSSVLSVQPSVLSVEQRATAPRLGLGFEVHPENQWGVFSMITLWAVYQFRIYDIDQKKKARDQAIAYLDRVQASVDAGVLQEPELKEARVDAREAIKAYNDAAEVNFFGMSAVLSDPFTREMRGDAGASTGSSTDTAAPTKEPTTPVPATSGAPTATTAATQTTDDK